MWLTDVLELPAVDLLESGLFALGARFAKDRGVQSRVRRLPARALPKALVGHRRDHLLAPHRLTGLLQHSRGGVQRADPLGLRLCFGLCRLGLARCLLACRFRVLLHRCSPVKGSCRINTMRRWYSFAVDRKSVV